MDKFEINIKVSVKKINFIAVCAACYFYEPSL